MACAADGGEKYLLGPAALTGPDVQTAEAVLSAAASGFVVEVTLTGPGSDRWGEFTGAVVGKRAAILVDGEVQSAPVIQEPLHGRKFEISTARMDRNAAIDLAARIAGG